MDEKIDKVFKDRMKWWNRVLDSADEAYEADEDERPDPKVIYCTCAIISEIALMYSQICGISYDEAQKILHKVGRNED